MENFHLIALAGLVGALGMSLPMQLISQVNTNAGNMVIALGSMITRQKRNAMLAGLLTHLISGIGFAFFYSVIPSALQVNSLAAHIGLGAMFGFFHGFAVSFLLVSIVSNHHPLPEFREASIATAASHVIGHLFYGIITMGMIYILGASLIG